MALRDVLDSLSGWFAPREHSDAPLAEEVLTRHAGRLMRMRGVMSVSVGRNAEGQPAIIIGLTNPLVASAEQIPDSLEGIPVIVSDISRPEPRDEY